MVHDTSIHAGFIAAKRLLNTADEFRGTNYICYALWHAEIKKMITRAQMHLCTEIIERRLAGHAYVTSFLCERGYLPKGDRTNEQYALVQEFRHRWLDSLIKEFHDA